MCNSLSSFDTADFWEKEGSVTMEGTATSKLALPNLFLFLSPQSSEELLFYFPSLSTISSVAINAFCFSQLEIPFKKNHVLLNILTDIFLFIFYEEST